MNQLKKKSIILEDYRSEFPNVTKEKFLVKKVVNAVEVVMGLGDGLFRTRQLVPGITWLTQDEVSQLCGDVEWTVTIEARKK